MTKSKNTIFKIVIALALILVSYFFIQSITNYSKNKNIYNIGNSEKYTKYKKAKGVAVFNEFVFENFDDIEIEDFKYKVFRANQFIGNTENNTALENARKINNINLKTDNNKNIDENYFENIKSNIIKDKLNNIELYDINNTKFYSKLNKYLDDYINNSEISFNESGYLINFIDGYESIYNLEDKELYNNIIENITNKNNINKISGLKYLDSKKFNIILVIDDINDIDKSILNEAIIRINNKDYNASLFSSSLYNDKVILNYTLTHGIEDFIEDRFIEKGEIKLLTIDTYRIPEDAIVELEGSKGFYYIDNTIVKFQPVEIVDKEDNFFIVSSQVSRAFPNKIGDANILFDSIQPFTDIIIRPNDIKEGDKY